MRVRVSESLKGARPASFDAASGAAIPARCASGCLAARAPGPAFLMPGDFAVEADQRLRARAPERPRVRDIRRFLFRLVEHLFRAQLTTDFARPDQLVQAATRRTF